MGNKIYRILKPCLGLMGGTALLALGGNYTMSGTQGTVREAAAAQFLGRGVPEVNAPAEIVNQAAAVAPLSSVPAEVGNPVLKVPAPAAANPLHAAPSKRAPVRTPGDILADSAMRLYGTYKDAPFVWGGETFWSYEETMRKPRYRGVSVTLTQPEGSWRAGMSSFDPFGTDCAGFIWVAAEGTGVEPLQAREGADMYRRKTYRVLPPGKYTADRIIDSARRGDLLFVMGGPTALHSMIYIGGGKVVECSGRERPDYDSIPPNVWERWREIAGPRGKNDWDRGGPQISPVSKYTGFTLALNSVYQR